MSNKKRRFLASIPRASIDNDDDRITTKCKFYFSYMDFNQPAGQQFADWDLNKLNKLLIRLIHFSEESLDYWRNQRAGNSKMLVVYGGFPKKSDFSHPKKVPHQAEWARFRISSKERLIGFIIPEEYLNKIHKKTGYYYDCNTFYVVFLDKDHKFYK